jgi:hypothetical protein
MLSSWRENDAAPSPAVFKLISLLSAVRRLIPIPHYRDNINAMLKRKGLVRSHTLSFVELIAHEHYILVIEMTNDIERRAYKLQSA